MIEPPISPEAEAGLLGSILLDAVRIMPNCISQGISPDQFYDRRNEKLFGILLGMDCAKIDMVSVVEQLNRKAPEIPKEYLLEISGSVDVSAHSESYMEILKETHQRREIFRISSEISISAQNGKTENIASLLWEMEEIHGKAHGNSPDIIDAADWYAFPPPESEPLISGICDLGDKIQVVAASKMRKTFFTLQLALSVSTGHSFLEWKIPKARKVLFLQFEIKQEHFWKRVHSVATAMHLDIEKLRGNLKIMNMRGADFSPSQIAPIAKRENIELVIIDPLYKLVDGDENSAQDMKPILAVFDRIMHETSAALLYVHHDTKGKAGDKNIRDRGAGSGVLARDYDACITLTAHRDDENAAVINTLLRNYAPQPAFVADYWDNKFSVSDLPAVAETSRNARVKQEVAVPDTDIIKQANCTITELRTRLMEKCGMTVRQQRRTVDDFLQSGKLAKHKSPGSRETWIATPGQIEQMKLDWRN